VQKKAFGAGAAASLAVLTAVAVTPAHAAEPEPAANDTVASSAAPEASEPPLAPGSKAGDDSANEAPAPAQPAPALPTLDPDISLNSPMVEEVAVSRSYVVSPSEKLGDEILLRSGQLELGGEWVFVTADGLPPPRSANAAADGGKIALTDLAFLRLRARRSFGKSVELFMATELLAKQPTRLNEPIWQAALAGLRAPFAKHFAFQLEGALGPTLGRSGWWWQAEPRVLLKARAGRELRFALDLGNSFTALELEDARPKPTWLDELTVGAEAQLGDHSGAFWIRTDYSVPLASSGQSAGPNAFYSGKFDPEVRVGLQVGGVLTISEHGWDAYAQYSWLDCGELSRPLTTLPILDGGFDQQQITLGVVHRFAVQRSAEEAE